MRPTTRRGMAIIGTLAALALGGCASGAESGEHKGGEANLQLPDFSTVSFGGVSGKALLLIGLAICVGGLVFGLLSFTSLRKLPVHASMREISELIYETCKAYLVQQGKFLLTLWLFIGAVIFVYFQFLAGLGLGRTLIVLLFSVIGMGGSYAIAWYGIRVNTFANSRTAFASLKGKLRGHSSPALGMSVGMMLISVGLHDAVHHAVPAGQHRRLCFIGFAIGESWGPPPPHRGRHLHQIADIGSDLMKIVFKIGRTTRNPAHRRLHRRQRRRLVGPSADGFETYGVTGVALITFILLASAPACKAACSSGSS